MSIARALGIGAASIFGFIVGTYLALYLVLTSMDWGQPFETELILIAIVLSTVLAIVGGVLFAPDRRAMWKPMAVGAIGIGLIALVVLLLVEADPLGMILVGLLESSAIVAGARTAA